MTLTSENPSKTGCVFSDWYRIDITNYYSSQILAHSVEYFTGEAEDYEDVDDDEDVFEGSDDEDDDD